MIYLPFQSLLNFMQYKYYIFTIQIETFNLFRICANYEIHSSNMSYQDQESYGMLKNICKQQVNQQQISLPQMGIERSLLFTSSDGVSFNNIQFLSSSVSQIQLQEYQECHHLKCKMSSKDSENPEKSLHARKKAKNL